jgi:hypothetical protein
MFEHWRHAVRHHKNRFARFAEPAQMVKTFLLKSKIARRQNLIHDQYFRIDLSRHRI